MIRSLFHNSSLLKFYMTETICKLFIIPLAITFGWLLTGLYHVGHLLAFGIAAIISLVIFNKSISKK